MASTDLITNKICPYAHRAWLTAEETKLSYSLKETPIKAGEKPAWFTELYKSSLGADPASDGKVPILVDGSFVLTESAVIVEYLIGKYGSPDTVTTITDPEQRARATIVFEQQIPRFTKQLFTLITAQEAEVQASAKKEILAALESISATFTHYGGPYFLGNRLSSADIQLWPFVARLLVLRHYRDFTIPQTSEYAAFHAYVDAMRSRPAVVATTMPDTFFIDAFKGLAEGTRKFK